MNLAERISQFLMKWKKLTQDQGILSVVEGYQIIFLGEPVQSKFPHSAKMNAEQIQLVNQEVRSMLKKGAIQKVIHSPREFISNLFLVDKTDRGKWPVINLKNLNVFIPYQHFKMEGLHLINDILQEGDLQNRSERCIFFSSHRQKSQKVPPFSVRGQLARVSIPLFWPWLSSFDFYKTTKSTNCITPSTGHPSHNLPGRYTNNGSHVTGINISSKHSNLPPAKLKICSEILAKSEV